PLRRCPDRRRHRSNPASRPAGRPADAASGIALRRRRLVAGDHSSEYVYASGYRQCAGSAGGGGGGAAMTIPAGLKKWLAFGRGAGIEIRGPHGAEALRVTAVRVRPGGATKLGELTIDDAGHHAAGVWGTEYGAFLREHGLSHVAATVLLPRRDVIVR